MSGLLEANGGFRDAIHLVWYFNFFAELCPDSAPISIRL